MEGLRKGYHPTELAELARELKRRGQDIRDGRLLRQALRERIAWCDRGIGSFMRIAVGLGAATGAIEADTETHVVTDWIDRIGRDIVIDRTLSIVQRNFTVPSVPIVPSGVTGRVGGALPPDRTSKPFKERTYPEWPGE